MTTLKLVLPFTFLLIVSKVICDDTQPTFKYVTSYNKDGRIITSTDLEKTSVNVLKPIIFIVNGLTNVDKENGSWSKSLQDSFLEKLIQNVFIVDWSITSPLESSSINKAHSVGLAVADFIATIFNKTGEAYLDIHLVGVSLGCEVAASAARRVSELFRRKINRITGLDPAYYLINDGDSRKLSTENADFVDVVHTVSKSTGELEQIGHVDFYVDDLGANCDSKDSTNCDLLKSVALFTKSVNSNNIKAKKCENLENFRKGACENAEQVIFGENVDKTVRGKYFLKYNVY